MRSINLQMDGNKICATWDNFDCLATSPAGFGDNISGAIRDLITNSSVIEINDIVTSIENAPQNAKELAATDSQQLKQAIALLHRWQGPERQDSREAQIKLEVESSQLMKSVAQRACV
jgi:hypothetical protein